MRISIGWLVVVIAVVSVVTWLGRGVMESRQAVERLHASAYMSHVALAVHTYQDAAGSLPPPAVYSKDGKPLLSWRVMILPYLEQLPLYNKFNLDEPWDSPNNLRLLAEM